MTVLPFYRLCSRSNVFLLPRVPSKKQDVDPAKTSWAALCPRRSTQNAVDLNGFSYVFQAFAAESL